MHNNSVNYLGAVIISIDKEAASSLISKEHKSIGTMKNRKKNKLCIQNCQVFIIATNIKTCMQVKLKP